MSDKMEVEEETEVIDQAAEDAKGNMEEEEPEEFQNAVTFENRKRRLGNFELKQHLGSGSFGRVYLATCKVENRTFNVALKVQWNRNRRRDVEREWRALSELEPCQYIIKGRRHGECIFTHENGKQSLPVYLPLEVCEHGSLSDFLRCATLSEKLVQEYRRQLVEALKFMKKKGIIHRDIKLSNTLIGADFILKVGDFGCCVFKEEKAEGYVGTPGYMAPEVIEHKKKRGQNHGESQGNGGKSPKPYDYKVDIFSSGCLFFAMKYRFQLFHGHKDVNSLQEYLKKGDKKSFWNTVFKRLIRGIGENQNLAYDLRHRAQFPLKQIHDHLKSKQFVGFPMVLQLHPLNGYNTRTCYSIGDVEELLKEAKQEDRDRDVKVYKFEEDMDLLYEMLAWDPSRRADIRTIMSHQTLEGRKPFSPKKEMEEKIKWANAVSREKKVKDQDSYAFAVKTAAKRSVETDDETEYNLFSKEFKALTDIAYEIPPLQHLFQKTEKIDETAFEKAINGKARIYNERLGPIKCFTKVVHRDSPFETMKALLAMLDHCKADVLLELDRTLAMKASLTLKGKKTDQNLQVQCLMHIYAYKEESETSIIEIRNLGNGNSDDFQKFYEALKAYFRGHS